MKTKNKRLILIFFIFIIQFSILNSQDTWEIEYDPFPYVDGYHGEDVVKCPDGGYAFCGSGFIWDPENPGFYEELFGITFKVDANGIMEWYDQDTISNNTLNEDYGLTVLNDAGIVTIVGPEMVGYWALVKRDTQGNQIWDINPDFAPHSLINCEDGGFIAVGNAPWGEDNMKKFSSDGELQWGKRIRASNLFSVNRSFDGGYITTGIYYGQNNGDVAVAKTDVNGDTLWTKYLDGFGDADYGKCVIETYTNDILVFCEFVNLYTGSPGYIWMLNQDGDTTDIEIIDQDIGWAIWSAKEYLDNSIITWGSGPEYNWILNRYDYNLDYLDTMDPISIGIGDKGFITEDEFLIYCQWPNLTVTKTLYQPANNCDDEIIVNDHILLSSYPNPFNFKTKISFQILINLENPILELFNIKGQLLESTEINSNINSFIWDASEYSSGIYLYQIKSENHISVINKMTLLK